MSTILKALHRLERDKDAQETQPLREQVAKTPARRRGWSSWLVAGATLTAGIAAGAAALLLWPGSGPETPEAGQGVQSEQSRPQADAQPGAAERGPRASAAERRTQGADGERSPGETAAERRARRRARRAEAEPSQPQARVASAERAEAEPSEVLPAQGLRPPEGTDGGAAAPRSEAEPSRPGPSKESSPEADPSEPPPFSPAAQPGSESAELRPEALASRVEVVERVEESPRAQQPEGREGTPEAPPPAVANRLRRAPVPEVFVLRTVWHPDAERRVAEVEVRGRPEAVRLHEGDAVGPLVVGRIEPSGVVFLHEQVELRRRVGAR